VFSKAVATRCILDVIDTGVMLNPEALSLEVLRKRDGQDEWTEDWEYWLEYIRKRMVL
jgi:hypothetical protein